MIPMIEVRKNKIVKDQMTLMIVDKRQGKNEITGIVNRRKKMSILKKKKGKEKAEKARRGKIKVVGGQNSNTNITKDSKKKRNLKNIFLIMKTNKKTIITVDMVEELKMFIVEVKTQVIIRIAVGDNSSQIILNKVKDHQIMDNLINRM